MSVAASFLAFYFLVMPEPIQEKLRLPATVAREAKV
jgi:hypothetical protein